VTQNIETRVSFRTVLFYRSLLAVYNKISLFDINMEVSVAENQDPSSEILTPDFDLRKRDSFHHHFVGYDKVRDAF
jgi:hypothetical protein